MAAKLIKFSIRAFIIIFLSLIVFSDNRPHDPAFSFLYIGIGMCITFMLWQWVGMIGAKMNRKQQFMRLISTTGSGIFGMGVFLLGMSILDFEAKLLAKGIGTSLFGLWILYVAHTHIANYNDYLLDKKK